MKTGTLSKRQKITRRKYLLYGAGLALLYPFFKFIGFRVPKKPVYVPVSKKVPPSGYILTRDFILFDRKGKCWALSRRCTHLGCSLTYVEELDILECPCHQSRFNPETGVAVRGPAERPLTFLPVEKRDGEPAYVVTT
jgi:cytochrome b6-f complex iron-sulfur subunit